MPQVTGDDLIAYYDARLVGELASDTGEAVDVSDIPSDPVVTKVLSAAAGEFMTAARTGGRYTTAQINALTGDDLEYMKAIICSVAMARLFRRRGESHSKEFVDSLTKDGRDAIKSLKDGDSIFGIPETVSASLISTDGPTVLDIQNMNGLTERMHRMFPSSQSRLPNGR